MSMVPGGSLVQKFGAKTILLTTVFLSAIVLAVTPLAVFYGGYKFELINLKQCILCLYLFGSWAFTTGGAIGLLVTRVLIGLLQGPVLPSVATLSITWFPVEERGRANSIAMMGINVRKI